MSKETYYFTHDYNARADRKLVNVIMKHGMQGIGVYWCLVEMLYEEGGYMPTEYDRISFELRTDTKVIQSIILDFELFKTDADKFWSDSVLDRLQERCDKSEKARESINKRWKKHREDTNVIRTNEDRNTKKESKGKENKEKEKNIIPPTLEMVKLYCEERNNGIDPQYYIDQNTIKGWVYGKHKIPIKDWQASIRTWEKYSTNKNTFTDEDFK